MKLKALIVDSTGYSLELLDKIFSQVGITCDKYRNGKEALESHNNVEYAFILVARQLEDMSGELFLHYYREKHTVGDALTIMITSDDASKVSLAATEAGYKLIYSRDNLGSLESFLVSVVNSRTLNLNGNILYIEDQNSLAAATVELFKNNHASIDHVTNLSDAKEKFSTKAYDLVITDYYLSAKETGGDIIEYVRGFNDSDKARIPILVVSGETDQTKRTSFLRSGANDFIIKPYDEDELVVRSSNLIENKKLFEHAKNQQKELTKLAMTDQLTGLYNRHSLFDIGPRYISDANRHKFSLALLVIDLDHFKNVNDTHGHAVGDIVLKAVGQVLRDNCRTEDFVARFGGEEFVMLLSHCDLDFAVTKAEALRAAIEKAKPNGLTITSSIGAATCNQNDDFDSLFEKADGAVYEAKDTGRNKVVAHSEKH